MEKYCTTISPTLLQNHKLKEQLAGLQDGFIMLASDNMELTSMLKSQQHVKHLGQLQETLEELKWMVELKNQEAPGLLEQ
jgi:hypothetical protein